MPSRPAALAAVATALALLAAATPGRAQYLDPDRCLTCRDKREHFAAGAALDILARGPWVARSFRDRAWKRVAITATVAVAWEVVEMGEARRDGRAGHPGYGFSPVDVGATVAGAVVVELVVGGVGKLLGR